MVELNIAGILLKSRMPKTITRQHYPRMTIKFTQTSYQSQLRKKQIRLNELLSNYGSVDLHVYPSEFIHYRMRAEFRVWHDGDDLYHVMFDPNTKMKYPVYEFPAASKTINKAMRLLIEELKKRPVLRKKLFQIDYLCGLCDELVVSLIYHRALDDEWEKEILALKNTLSSVINVNFIGRARKQKIVIDKDYIIEKLHIGGKDYSFKHIENSFTQPNANVNIQMIEWALNIASTCHGDLLEFYCGAGNFTLPLASNFKRVVGTEIAKPSVDAAQFNIHVNKIDNVSVVRLSAEEFVQALFKEKSFRRLADLDLDLFNFETVLVDPPRSGLDEATLRCVQQFQNIFYISCNPETLAENLKQLTQTHAIQKAALFDQFPYTHHIEAGVFLTKHS